MPCSVKCFRGGWGWMVVAVAALAVACDAGSTVHVRTGASNTCSVSMKSNDSGFAILMTLACAGNEYQRCYEITELYCQGKKVELPAAVVVNDCPGKQWCIDSCVQGLSAPGTLWDIPNLLGIDACNVYTHP